GVVEYALDLLRAALDDGAERLLLDGRDPSADIVRNRVGAADVHPAGDRTVLDAADRRPNLLAYGLGLRALGEHLLRAHPLGGLGQIDRAAAIHHPVGHIAERRI